MIRLVSGPDFPLRGKFLFVRFTLDWLTTWFPLTTFMNWPWRVQLWSQIKGMISLNLCCVEHHDAVRSVQLTGRSPSPLWTSWPAPRSPEGCRRWWLRCTPGSACSSSWWFSVSSASVRHRSEKPSRRGLGKRRKYIFRSYRCHDRIKSNLTLSSDLVRTDHRLLCPLLILVKGTARSHKAI